MKKLFWLVIPMLFFAFGFTSPEVENDGKPVYEKLYSGTDLVAEGWSLDGLNTSIGSFIKTEN